MNDETVERNPSSCTAYCVTLQNLTEKQHMVEYYYLASTRCAKQLAS